MAPKIRVTTNDEKPRHDQPDEVVEGKHVTGMRRGVRYFPAAHYLVKITSFSASTNADKEAYDCGMFQAGGHKWKLVVYPKGNKTANGSGFISLYLELVEPDKDLLPQPAGEVNLMFKLFLLDQIRDKYLTVEDADGEVKRLFYRLKSRCGFSRFISLESFREPANGYLMEDCCVLGAEVHVFERSSLNLDCFSMKVDCFSTIEPSSSDTTFSWRIKNFSKLNKAFYRSDSFFVADLEWRLKVYPKGKDDKKGKALAVYLELVGADLLSSSDQKKYAEFTLCVKNQAAILHRCKHTSTLFSSTVCDWGFTEFMSLQELCDASNGYVVNDTLIVEATISSVEN